MQNYFHNVQVSCYCCVTWYETRTIFSLLYSHLRWSFCGVMLLHVTRVGTGSFAVLVFLHSSIIAFGRGHTIKQLPRGPGITRPLHTPELDQVSRSWWKLQSSASQQEPVLGLFHLFHLNSSRTLRGPRASVDRVNVDLYAFQIIVSKFEVWKGRHFIGRPQAAPLTSLRHCVGLSWLTEYLTGTLWLTDRGAGTKPLKPGLSRLKRDVWYA